MLAALTAPVPASADIIATFDHRSPLGGVRVIQARNAVTAAPMALPAAVNDPSSNQIHPALSPNGRFLVFQRVVDAAGTVRIVMVDRTTGQSADLFDAFEAAADRPSTPTFSSDGTKVLTGRRLEHLDASSPPGALQSSFTETDVTGFPTGPFPHRVVLAGGADSDAAGRTLQGVTLGSDTLAFGLEQAGGAPPGRIVVRGANGTTTLSDPMRRFAHPALSKSAGVVTFESAPAATPSVTRLAFRPLDGFATAPSINLPAIVNAIGATESDPAFTPDGRYLAFIRDRFTLFVWDTQTQLLLNPRGLRFIGPDLIDGAMALEARRVLTSTTLTGGRTGFTLSQGSTTGLLVQRVVGRRQVLGRAAPRLERVGLVPLGTFPRGHHSKRWSFTVNGQRLGSGCYLVTFRALTRTGQVRDLSTPYTVRVAGRRGPLVGRGIRLSTCDMAPRV